MGNHAMAIKDDPKANAVNQGGGSVNKLLADTKLPENIPEDLIGGHFTGDGTQLIQRLTDIDGDQIGGDVFAESVFDAFDAVKCV